VRNDKYWLGMPRFHQEKKKDIKITCVVPDGSLFARFRNAEDLVAFTSKAPTFDGKSAHFESRRQLSVISDQKITEKTKSIWFPFKSHWGNSSGFYTSSMVANPQFPVYIVSKGRHKNGLTTKALARMGVNHYIVVEPQEFELYQSTKNEFAELIALDMSYLDNYDTCDNLGFQKSKGPGAARNFCIDHSKELGFSRHWVMDDNLDDFHYLTDNKKLPVRTGASLLATELFVCQFSNVPVAGLNYYSFCKANDAVPPYVCNTRIYSCLLIDNQGGYRWRGRYNEDNDLSLRVLKDGLCTIQMNAFLCGKVTTQRMSGGNTQEFYSSEGTLPKSQMLADLHPDVAKVVWKFNRWHHHVDYKKFKGNKLILKDKMNPLDFCFELKEGGADK
jgi:hypothetical protein